MHSKKAALIPCIMAAANSACMAFVMCWINIGFHGPFLAEFIKSFLIGLVVTLPISYLLPIFLNKILK